MRTIRLVLAAALLPCALPATAQDRPFGSDDAFRIAADAVKAAKTRGRPIAIAIVNREGRLIAAMRMDGVSYLNLEVAQAKALTAAALGAPTSALEQAVEGGKTSLLTVPGLSAIGGGLPVVRGGQVVAGIGVSGGSPQEDEAAAKAAIGN